MHIDYIGLAEAISKAVQFWDRENWEDLLPNIILAGGSSLIPGLDQRLKVEISKYFSEKLKDIINVIAVSGRENIGWIGSSVLWAQNKLQKGWIQNPNQEETNQEQHTDFKNQINMNG
ncbi:MAG: hypothetical protein ACFFG0_28295, partial [Candidatus Thorarchaeota archaeon]